MKISDYFYFVRTNPLPTPPAEPLPPGQLTPHTQPISLPTQTILSAPRLSGDFIQSLNETSPVSTPSKTRYAEIQPFDIIFTYTKMVYFIATLSKPFCVSTTHNHILRATQPLVIHPLIAANMLRRNPSQYYTTFNTLVKQLVLETHIEKTLDPNTAALATTLKAQEIIVSYLEQIALLRKLQSTALIKWANNEPLVDTVPA